jgi:hypothetical protein
VHRAVLARRLLDRVGSCTSLGTMMQVTVRSVARDAHRAVDQVPHLRRHHRHVHVVAGDVLEQRDQVDLLLVVAAERRARLLADDRHHRLVVELGVVQAVEQVDGARAGGRQAHADLAGELGVRAGHEGGQFLVARLHELRSLAGAVRARP